MKLIKTYIFVCCFTGLLSAQETLTKMDAVAITLENNYGILLSNNSNVIATNNASVYNTGYLPTISGSGNATYTNNNNDYTLQNGVKSSVSNADSQNYGASIGINYVLFDGFGRSYNFKKLQQSAHLSKLETKAVIEQTVIQLFNTYYFVAEHVQHKKLSETSLEISKTRLTRAQYMYEYGQTTKLEILNAEVDVNNDRIKLINIEQLLNNAKREINLILGRDIATEFNVEDTVKFDLVFNIDMLLKDARQQNIAVQQLNKSINIAALDIKINTAGYLPSLNLNGGYGWSKTNNDATFIYDNQIIRGINAGLNLSWNIFDGGRTKIKVANSKIIADNLKIQAYQLKDELELYVRNALTLYQNDLIIIASEKKNVETNQRNFDRSKERYKLGQITSIEFRQAQINLLNAQTNLNKATYAAKNASLTLLQLSGTLLEQQF